MMPDQDDETLRLNAHDLQSAVWAKLKKHMQARLHLLRVKNDNDMDPIKTANLRGEIRSLKNLLALGQPNQAMGADDETAE